MSLRMRMCSRIWLGMFLLSACASKTSLKSADAKAAEDAGAPEASPGRPDTGADAQVVADLPTEMLRSLCGNGELDRGEQCEDGNTISGDGCSSTCMIETEPPCPTPPCVRRILCGDGILDSGEACDDGNASSGDGCSKNCDAVEVGWRCRVPGAPCSPICGDGLQVWRETCDDGNTADGDGCSLHCLTEPGWDCTGGPCVPLSSVDGGIDGGAAQGRCGDGILSGAEECDLGASNDDAAYGGCSTKCWYGPFCGDGMRNGPEECDLGQRNGLVFGEDGCTRACTRTHYCGDGMLDTSLGEECDLGGLNGVWVDHNLNPSTDPDAFMVCTFDCLIPHYVWQPAKI